LTLIPEHRIIISPINELEADLLRGIGDEVQRVFGFAVEIEPLLDNLDFAYNADRAQYHTTPILDRLADLAPPHALRVAAVARVDLFIPILTHVYGEAQLGGRACIVSTYRLDENLSPAADSHILFQRVIKEAVHELGHTFDLRHCRDPQCIMHYCRAIEDVDRKSNDLCRYCGVMLQDQLAKL